MQEGKKLGLNFVTFQYLSYVITSVLPGAFTPGRSVNSGGDKPKHRGANLIRIWSVLVTYILLPEIKAKIKPKKYVN